MPSEPRVRKPNRLNLELTDEVRAHLETLKTETQADSMAEVIRQALAVYEFMWQKHTQGAEMRAHFPDGRQTVVEFLWPR